MSRILVRSSWEDAGVFISVQHTTLAKINMLDLEK